MNIEGRIYHYGLKAGFPYAALNTICNSLDAARHASEIALRRRLASEILAGSSLRGFIPRETGYALVQPDTLPGTREALEAVREIIAARRKTGWERLDWNPVDHLQLPEHFRDYPQLLNFALSDTVLQIVSDYYGLVPQLKDIGIWVTRPQKERFNSQLFHFDKPEVKILALFLNVEMNDEERGPTTIIPINVSRKVRRAINYEKRYFCDEGFVPDETMFKFCRPEDQISLGGAPGTGAFADTSNCFHYGSRCKAGERIMMMVKFMLPHKARKRRTRLFDLVPKPADEVRSLVLCGAAFA